MNEEQLCLGYTCLDDGWTELECGLPPGHKGDHEAVYRWPKTPEGPRPGPELIDEFLRKLWEPHLLAVMNTALPRLPDPMDGEEVCIEFGKEEP